MGYRYRVLYLAHAALEALELRVSGLQPRRDVVTARPDLATAFVTAPRPDRVDCAPSGYQRQLREHHAKSLRQGVAPADVALLEALWLPGLAIADKYTRAAACQHSLRAFSDLVDQRD